MHSSTEEQSKAVQAEIESIGWISSFSSAMESLPPPVLCLSTKSKKESSMATSPLTIFYNDAVTVFDVSRYQAEAVLKLAEEAGGGRWEEMVLQQKVEEDPLPMARRKSLERFLQRRKQRSAALLPYGGDKQDVAGSKETRDTMASKTLTT